MASTLADSDFPILAVEELILRNGNSDFVAKAAASAVLPLPGAPTVERKATNQNYKRQHGILS